MPRFTPTALAPAAAALPAAGAPFVAPVHSVGNISVGITNASGFNFFPTPAVTRGSERRLRPVPRRSE